MRHFSHTLVDTSQAYHYYTTLMGQGTTLISLTNAFKERYHSISRRTRFSRQLKSISFKKYRQEEPTDDAAFKKVLSEIDRLACLVHPEDRTPHALSSILWQAVLGQPWALVAQTKDGMNMNYAKAVDSLSDALQGYSDYQTCRQQETPILYEQEVVREGQHDQQDQENQENDVHLTEENENNDILFNNQRRYNKHPSSLSRYNNRRPYQQGQYQTRPYNPSYQRNGTTSRTHTNNANNVTQQTSTVMICFNCLRPDCRVSRCKIPKDQDRIRKNLAVWKQARIQNRKRPNSVKTVEPIFSIEDLDEILIADQNCSPTNAISSTTSSSSSSINLATNSTNSQPSSAPTKAFTNSPAANTPTHYNQLFDGDEFFISDDVPTNTPNHSPTTSEQLFPNQLHSPSSLPIQSFSTLTFRPCSPTSSLSRNMNYYFQPTPTSSPLYQTYIEPYTGVTYYFPI